MPPALLAAVYMATSAQENALDAQESLPLPGPWTLMTVRVPPAVTTSRAIALPGTMSTMSRTSSAANTSARKGNQEPAAHRCRRRCLGVHPWVRMIPVVTPLIQRVYHTLRVLQAGLLEEAQDGTLGLHDALRHRLTVEHTWAHWYAVPPHRALDVPGHRPSGVGGGTPSWLHVWITAPRRIRISGRRGATSRFRGTTRTRRGRPARWPLSPWASAQGGRRLLRPGRCGGLPLCLSAGCTCRQTPRRSHCPTPCCRPNRSRSCRRRRRPALRRRAGTRGQHERSGPRLGRRKRPAWHSGITPASMASAWSRCAGSVAWSCWMWSSRSLGWRWVGRQCVPGFHVQ